MESIVLEFLNNHINLFTYFGSYILFIAGLLESIPFFGFFVPGQTIILIGGFVAKFSPENCHLFLFAGAIGAITGDIAAYFLGRKYGYPILNFFGGQHIKPIYIERTKKLLQAHTGKTLIIGRFNPLTRSLAPFIAGTVEVNSIKFIFFTILGGVMWSSTFFLIGFGLGASFHILGIAVGKLMSLIVVTTTLIIVMIFYSKRKGLKITQGEILVSGISLVLIYLFTTISHIISKTPEIPIDRKIHIFFVNNPVYIHFMKTITDLGERYFIIALTIILSTLLWIKNKKTDAVNLILSISISAIIIVFTKDFFSRERPSFSHIAESSSSFPSGHAMISATFFWSLYFIFGRNATKPKKIFLLILAIIFPLAIAFSRIALGVHFLSDVIAGLALGIFISCVVEILAKLLPWIYKEVKNKKIIPNL